MRAKYTASSGNVFEDLGLSSPGERKTKAEIAALINSLISDKSQTEAAELLGITQPQVSDLSRGKLKHFSVERLFGLLLNLGHDVDIVIRKADQDAKVEVIAA